MKKMLSLALGAVLLITTMLSGCSSKEDALVGNWATSDNVHQFIFLDDGTLSAGSNGRLESGTYSCEDGSLIVTISSGESQVFEYELDENTLTLTSMGQSMTLYRTTT